MLRVDEEGGGFASDKDSRGSRRSVFMASLMRSASVFSSPVT